MVLVNKEEFENIISLLLNIDKELDELRVYAEKARREILEFARNEASIAKEEALKRVRVVADDIVKQAQYEAKAEAERIIKKNKEALTKLKERIEVKLNDAILFTMDVLLGKKEIT
jgi:vacuolar-type H+-ATPase subunit H